MKIADIEEIKELVERAKIVSAKSEGEIEAIKKEWKKTYGTDSVDEIRKILQELEEEKNKTSERKELLQKKLFESYDWEQLEKELEQ